MKKEAGVSVSVTHWFSASPERVFDAWLDPDKACKFLFVTATGQMQRTEIDGRVGGRFTIVERRAGEDVAHVGTYLEIDRPRRLVFTLTVPKYSQEEDRISVEIKPARGGSELTLTHEMSTKAGEHGARAQEGWKRVLEMLDELLPEEAATCGAGLAQHAPIPAKMAAVFAALAETLEAHRPMLILSYDNARREDEAYRKLAEAYRDVAARTAAAAALMASYRDLPACAHDETAFGKGQLAAFESFVKAQNQLLEVLAPAAKRDEVMLVSMTQ